MNLILQSAVSGLLVGGMYGLVALGLALAFGVLRVLNLAHGELVMLGGYATFFLVAVVGLDPFLSLPIVFALLFGVGVVLYLLLFRFVVRFEIETRIKNSLLISFGLVLILQTLAIMFFTADARSIITDYSTAALTFGSIRVPVIRLAGLCVAVILAVGLQVLLERTTFGHAVKATSEDWSLATLTGIDVRRIYLWAFALSAALAGVAGTLIALGFSVSPSIGLGWTLKALIVVVLAGLGSMRGLIIAGMLLGLAEGLASVWLGGAYREIVALGAFLLVMLLRPQGLFGRARG
jgi:branched-chain amino acid transport system permease protein